MIAERERAMNHIRYSGQGALTWRDENKRCVVRLNGASSTMPACGLYENWNDKTLEGDFVGYAFVESAIDFLYDEEYELVGLP